MKTKIFDSPWRIVAECAWWAVGGVFFVCTFGSGVSLKILPLLALVWLGAARVLWCKIENPVAENFLRGNVFCENSGGNAKFDWRVFFALFVFYSIAVLLGRNFSCPDTVVQWEQVMTLQFNDWHPVPHTLCIWALTFPCRSLTFFAIAQSTIFAAMAAVAFPVLKKHCSLRPSVALAVVFIATLHPAVVAHLCTALKDIAMAIALFGVTLCTICIAGTRGAWLRSPFAFGAFVFAALASSLFRHNGIFFTFPLLLMLPLLAEKRFRAHCVAAACAVFVLFAGTKIAVERYYPAPAREVSQTYVETIGIPVGILANVAKEAPEKLPPSAQKFIEGVAPLEVWQTYKLGDANTGLKWEKEFSSGLRRELAKLPPKDFLKMVGETALAAPKEALNAFAHHVGPFWRLDNWPGTWVAILLFAGIFALPILKWRTLPLTLPVFLYQTGTSLLMYGKSDVRFYVYAISVCLPLTAIILALSLRERASATASQESSAISG